MFSMHSKKEIWGGSIVSMVPLKPLLVSAVAVILMLYGCLFMHESQLRFAYSLRRSPNDPAPRLVETFMLRGGGEVRLVADSRSNATYMIATDYAGHVIDVASVFYTSINNDILATQALAIMHILHLMSMAAELGETTWMETWLHMTTRAIYATIACVFAFAFITIGLDVDAGASDIERAAVASYVIGGVVTSVMIVAGYERAVFATTAKRSDYTHIIFTMDVKRPDTCDKNLLADVDLGRCTDGTQLA